MRFTTSSIDYRKLTQPWHLMAKQHPGRREHIHGRIHAMDCECRSCRKPA